MCCRITENVWKNSGFPRSKEGLLCTTDLVCSFFKFISHIFQRESDKYIQLAPIVDFVFPYKLLIFPPSCPSYPCHYNCEGFYGRHLWFPLVTPKVVKSTPLQFGHCPFLRTVVFVSKIHLPWLLCLIKSFSSINRSWSESSSQNLQ